MAKLTCICGATDGEPYKHGGLDLLKCKCGTARRAGNVGNVDAQYRSGDYHRSTSRHTNCAPYADRYDHDLQIAALRWERYKQFVEAGPELIAVDVGAANGAFVDYLSSLRISAWGVEPSPDFASKRVLARTLSELLDGPAKNNAQGIRRATAGLVTYHDVLEHLSEPIPEIILARHLLVTGGLLILDVPYVWDGAGEHHYKLEHLFYFGEDSLRKMLRRFGFLIAGRDRPIPSKLVIYARKL